MLSARISTGMSRLSYFIVLGAALLAGACSDTLDPAAPGPVASVGVQPPSRALVPGDTITLEARPLDAAGRIVTGRAIAWSTTDTTVARVDARGMVTAVGAGSTQLRATVDSRTGSTLLVVAVAPVASVELNPSALSLVEGAAATVAAVARDAAGRVLANRPTVWISRHPGVADVDSTGRIVARSAGLAIITAIVEGRSVDLVVTVLRIGVARVTVTPAAAVLETGQARQYSAAAFDAAGNAVTGRAVAWSVVGTAASITASGLLTGLQPGYVTITATVDGVSSSVAATVVAEEASDYDLMYHREMPGNVSEIWIGTIGSSAPHVRLNAGSVSSDPTASPDGRRIAFTVTMIDPGTLQRVDDIHVVDRNGMNTRRLTTAPGVDDHPAWSPNGAQIAYRHMDAEGAMSIWVMNADGSNQRLLTGDMGPMMGVNAPAWSPDGSRIAFAASWNGVPGTATAIYTMRADGSDKRQLTHTFTGFDTYPTWSPDGRRIAFARWYAGDADITIVGVDGGATTRLALAGNQATPAWSPDGRYIAFIHGSGPTRLHTMRPDGTDVRARTTWASGSDQAPGWIRRP